MNLEEKYFAYLLSQPELSSSKMNTLLCEFKLPSKVFALIKDGNECLEKFIEKSSLNALKDKCEEKLVENCIKNLQRKNVGFLSVFNPNISNNLKEIFELCNLFGLFYIGDVSLLETKCIGVVGSRMPDVYGKRVTEEFCNVFAKCGLTIVSGLAGGVDSIAHNCALKNNGKTIAVLANGFDHIYPAFNAELARKVAQCGLIVSEHAPFVKANTFHFPIRNRIIAGICDGVLITQMREKSGALHTKNYAIDYGKNLYVVVSDCFKETSRGNLNTIEEFPSSACVSPARILQDYGIGKEALKTQTRQLSFEEQAIVNCLKNGEKHYDEIVFETKFPPNLVNSLLTTLKISGIIKQLVGNYFSL